MPIDPLSWVLQGEAGEAVRRALGGERGWEIDGAIEIATEEIGTAIEEIGSATGDNFVLSLVCRRA